MFGELDQRVSFGHIIRKMIINFMLSGLSAIKLNDHLFKQQLGLFCRFCEYRNSSFSKKNVMKKKSTEVYPIKQRQVFPSIAQEKKQNIIFL